MRRPFVLVSLSAVLAAAALMADLPDLALIAVPMGVAALILVLLGRGRRPRPKPDRARREVREAGAARWIVVDGSNVMHWEGGTPQVETLRRVIGQLQGDGLTPVVWFDANAGYKLNGRYQNRAAMARLLGLPEAQVEVMPRGEPADPALLAEALRLNARVVSNDRYRDWLGAAPGRSLTGRLVPGELRGRRVHLHR